MCNGPHSEKRTSQDLAYVPEFRVSAEVQAMI